MVKNDMKAIFYLMTSERMRWVLPEIAWTGISLAVYTGLLVPMIVDTIPNDN
jgi:hypothetical protein